MKPIYYEIMKEPVCRLCQTKLTQLGNSLRDGTNDTVTTYGWCVRCNYYQWSLPWETHKTSSQIIKDQYR